LVSFFYAHFDPKPNAYYTDGQLVSLKLKVES